MVFSTLLGGSGDEEFTSIGVDSGGNIYISGSTDGPFPIVNAENGIYEPFRFCAPHSTCGGAALPPTQGIALKVAPVSGTVLAFPSVVNLVNPVAIGTSITATILVANPNSSNNITISGIGFTNSRLILEEACSRRTGRIGL